MRRMENFLENADRKIQRGLRSVQKAVKMVNIKSCFLVVCVFCYWNEKLNILCLVENLFTGNRSWRYRDNEYEEQGLGEKEVRISLPDDWKELWRWSQLLGNQTAKPGPISNQRHFGRQFKAVGKIPPPAQKHGKRKPGNHKPVPVIGKYSGVPI